MRPVDAMILAGGLGTRLRETVGDRPKPLAEIGGRPFLDILINDLVRQRISRIILCVGYLGEQIIARYAGRADAEVVFSEEASPLGTGGAVKHAASRVKSDPFLLLNGDSFCRVDYAAFLAFHATRRADVSMVVARGRGRTDAGNVTLGMDGRIVSFSEKPAAPTGSAFINAGIYLMPLDLPGSWSRQYPFSLEREILPGLVRGGSCYGYVVDEEIIDIGTPERFAAAQAKF